MKMRKKDFIYFASAAVLLAASVQVGASQYSADLAKRLRERAKVEAEAANGSVDV